VKRSTKQNTGAAKSPKMGIFGFFKSAFRDRRRPP
jgi:hypothetical protein